MGKWNVIDVTLLLLLVTVGRRINASTTRLSRNEFPPPSPTAGLARSTFRTGQTIRLRNGGVAGRGRLEVFLEGRWGLVCDDFFDKEAANVACKQMGFHRGAQSFSGASKFGHGSLRHFSLDNVRCQGDEPSLLKCQRAREADCEYKTETAGVRCTSNWPSRCAAGGHLFNGKCYTFHGERKSHKSFADARRVCEQRDGGGGRLTTVMDQRTNDFMSDTIFAENNAMVNTRWYTAGQMKDGRWKWRVGDAIAGSPFTKWRPGYRAGSHSTRCMVLRHNHADLVERDYFLWDTADCKTKRPFVCESPTRDVGCVQGTGVDYEGAANVSKSGNSCVKWNGEALMDKGVVFDGQARWSHNYCRNPDSDTHPWCMINDQQFEQCDIPKCNEHNQAPLCEPDEVRCGRSVQCVARDFMCDYEKDCHNGFDEQNCTNWLSNFDRRASYKIVRSVSEIWAYIPHAQGCAKRCMTTGNDRCESFSYERDSQRCLLSISSTLQNRDIAQSNSSDYYVRRSAVEEGKECRRNQYECDDGQCVPMGYLCDGRRHCKDGSDEAVCDTFELRLVDGVNEREGRVEVRLAERKWGMVCDDGWGMHDARVVCKQLGFGDALRATTSSHFASHMTSLMSNKPINMDEVGCKGNETSLLKCSFAGWQQNDCDATETAGVVCAPSPDEAAPTPATSCNAAKTISCGKNGECVDVRWLCDGEADCGNGFDENKTLCDTPLDVRLIDGPTSNSGRVEVRRFNVWGSICDDIFDANDARVICRMLGYGSRVTVLGGGHFGESSGPIWVDELMCKGEEENLNKCRMSSLGRSDCKHNEDVAITCYHDSDVEDTRHNVVCGTRTVNAMAHDPRKQRLARVVGGFDAVHGAYPWTVGLRYDGRHHCGATLISEKYLLTAAHCFDVGRPLSNYSVVLGDFNNNAVEAGEQFFDVRNVTKYPDYTNILEHDIALVELRVSKSTREYVKFTDFVQPICLPHADTPYSPGQSCVVSGWGTLSAAGSYPRVQQAAQLPIIEGTTCRHATVYGDTVSDTSFCAGFLNGGADSCQGDSGGPYACRIDDKFHLLGIISWGDGCGEEDKPGVYTRVVDYLTWIRGIVTNV